MERRELLKTKAEQMRLMEEVPEVIAEVIAIEPIPDDAKEKLKQGDENPPKSILNANSDTLGYHWGDKIYSSGMTLGSQYPADYNFVLQFNNNLDGVGVLCPIME